MSATATAAIDSGDIHDPTSAAYKKARRNHWKSTRNRPEHVDADWTPFRAAEKKYKARFPPPDLSEVLDIAAGDASRTEETSRGGWKGRADSVNHREIPLRDGPGQACGQRAYIFPGTPGLVLLPSFVPPTEQRQLVRWALRDHARNPNETNLDTHYMLPKDGLWNQYLRVRRGECEDVDITPHASLSRATTPGLDAKDPTSATQVESPGPRKLISNEAASPSNYLDLVKTPKLPAPPSQTLRSSPTSALIPKLRWANIGWYYHWGTKQYDFTRGPGEIDGLVRSICRRAVESIPWEKVFEGPNEEQEDNMVWGSGGPDWMYWDETYEPDAGIVNFYQTKDTLMAHVDRSEICATSPLVSISLGCAAVFLIGGLTRDDLPIPILLRSGDVVVMSGPACRRAYHGVPRILEGTLPPHLEGNTGSDLEDGWDVYEGYLRKTRINVNVRQVFPKGFKSPHSAQQHRNPKETEL